MLNEDVQELKAFKSNYLIQLNNCTVKTWDTLTLNQLKLTLLSASKVQKDDTHETEYQITFQEFKKLAGYSEKTQGGSHYNNIYKDARALAKSGVDFITPDGDIVIFNWLTSVVISPKKGVVTYNLDKHLIPLYKASHGSFSIIQIFDAMQLKSTYSYLLYEFLTKWKEKGSVFLEINSLREQLKVPENKYKRISDVILRIVSPAIDEINEKAQFFDVKFNVKRGKRNVTEGVYFFIYPKNQEVADTSEDVRSIVKLLNEHKIYDPAATRIAKSYPLEYIKHNLAYIDQKKEKYTNLEAAKIRSIENNWSDYQQSSLFTDEKSVDVTSIQQDILKKQLEKENAEHNLSEEFAKKLKK